MAFRKKHSTAFKFKIALEALQGRSIADICRQYHVAQSLVHKWRDQLKTSASRVFGDPQSRGQSDWQREREKLYQHIGELSTQLSFLKKVLGD